MTDYAFWRTHGGRACADTWPMPTSTTSRATLTTGTTAVRASTTNGGRCRGLRDGCGTSARRIQRSFLTEFASHEDTSTPGRKASWINDVQQLFKQPGWEQFQGILYYHQSHKPTCLFWLDSSTTSMAAITALANDPFFGRYEVGSDVPPTAPGKPAASSDAPGQVTLNWQAATDDHATTLLYRIDRDQGRHRSARHRAHRPASFRSRTRTCRRGHTRTRCRRAMGRTRALRARTPMTSPLPIRWMRRRPHQESLRRDRDAPGQVTLNWQAATDDHATTLLYRLYRDQGTTPVGTTSSSSTGIVSFTDTNVPAGTHTYAVSASDGSNEGPRSADSEGVSVAVRRRSSL